jgi:adenine phosphoribosyltransferase
MAKEQVPLAQYIRAIPDWPKKGILFRDITPLLGDPEAFSAAIEARGFIFGAAVAARLRAGFIPIRKKGKLPCRTESASYALEYGTDCIEMHSDAIQAGDKVLLVDDLLATGGTMRAACELMEKVGAQVVGIACVIELRDLQGRERLTPHEVHALISY